MSHRGIYPIVQVHNVQGADEGDGISICSGRAARVSARAMFLHAIMTTRYAWCCICQANTRKWCHIKLSEEVWQARILVSPAQEKEKLVSALVISLPVRCASDLVAMQE
jgi:hypothetical protein